MRFHTSLAFMFEFHFSISNELIILLLSFGKTFSCCLILIYEGLNYKDTSAFNWCPHDCAGGSPIASYRLALSDVLASSSGSMAPRWFPLIMCGTISPESSQTCLGGGVQLGVELTSSMARGRIIHEASSRLMTRAGFDQTDPLKQGSSVKLLQNWGLCLGSAGETGDCTISESVLEDESQIWDTGLGMCFMIVFLLFECISQFYFYL